MIRNGLVYLVLAGRSYPGPIELSGGYKHPSCLEMKRHGYLKVTNTNGRCCIELTDRGHSLYEKILQ